MLSLDCGQVLLVALSDGAGSAEQAELGARTAVEAALQSMEELLRDCSSQLYQLEKMISSKPALEKEAELESSSLCSGEVVLDSPPSAEILPHSPDDDFDSQLEQPRQLEEFEGQEPLLTDYTQNPNDATGPQTDFSGLIRTIFEQARQALLDLSENEGIPLRSLAATLTCVIAMDNLLAVGQLGDGLVVLQTDGEELLPATRLQRGEYANETYFLTQEDVLDQLQMQVICRPVQALAVMSDGLIRLAMKMTSNEPHAPFFKPLLAFAAAAEDAQAAQEQLAAFLSSERVCSRTDDDKSLVLAVRRK